MEEKTFKKITAYPIPPNSKRLLGALLSSYLEGALYKFYR